MIEIFLRQMPELLSDIRNALENSDSTKLEIAAHTLKGSLQILCADDACSVAAELEIAGKTGRFSDGLKRLSQLEAELAGVAEQITKFLEIP